MLFRASWLLVGLAAIGCGGTKLADVSGEVKIDGGPLEAGEIIFESPNMEETPNAAEIKNGKYHLQTAPGPKKVKISASRGNGIIDPLMKQEGQEPMIPEEFNVQTKLTADLKPGPQTGVNFDVTSIPK